MAKINKIKVDGTDYDIEDENAVHSESDPTVPNYVKSISENDIENWNGKADASDVEEMKEKLDKQIKLSMLNRNAGLQETKIGTDLTFDDTAECQIVTALSGNHSQNSTTGKNLFGRLEDGTYTIYGVTAVVKDGIVTLNGTSTGEGTYIFKQVDENLNGTYTLSINSSGSISGGNIAIVVNNNGNYVMTRNQTANSVTATLTNQVVTSYELYMNNGLTFTNFVIKPQLELNSSATDYEPYTGGIATPNPDYPQEIKCVTGEQEISICNKNLAYTGWAEDFVNRVNDTSKAKILTYDNKNCLYYTASAGYNDYDNKYMFKTNWKENTQYSISFDLKASLANTGNIAIYYTDGTYKSFTAQNTIPANTWKNIGMVSETNKTIKYIAGFYNDGNCYIDLDSFMVEEGTTQTNYVEHQSQTYPLSLGTMEFLDDDEIRRDENGNYYKYAKWAKVIFDGSENWQYHKNLNNNNTFHLYFRGSLPIVNNKQLCNIGTYWTSNWNYGRNNTFQMSKEGQANQMVYTSNNFESANEFKNYLQEKYEDGEPMYVCYELETPETTIITDSTLISQLDDIYYATSYNGQTNISQEYDEKPFKLTMNVVKDLNKVISNITNAVIEIGGDI
ncbi:MAG: hypothetical protein IJ690_07615 [Clostridia bacterium]|nr:hypothetical protein [Clostridia bacterium]MBR1654773.1 hypothetical protein [Clostridia bacterium]